MKNNCKRHSPGIKWLYIYKVVLDYWYDTLHGLQNRVREENRYIVYVAYPLNLFREGSATNMFISIAGNVFGFKVLCSTLEDLRIPIAYVKTTSN